MSIAGCSERESSPPTHSADSTDTPSSSRVSSSSPSATDRDLSAVLDAGSVNLYLRPPAPRTTVEQSAYVETSAAPTAEVPTAEGRAIARAIGDAITTLVPSIDEVRTGGRPLDRETARLAFGHGRPAASVAPTETGTAASSSPTAGQPLATALTTPPAAGAVNVVIGPGAAITQLTGTSLAPGECAIIDPQHERAELVATGRPTEWATTSRPDTQRVTAYQLRRETPQATPVVRIRTGTPGPTILILGGMHGDEVAGYRAANTVTTWAMTAGTVVVIPRANVPAIDRGTRTSSSDVDLNRQFPLDAPPSTPLAKQLYNCVVRHEPALVVDLHSSQGIWGEGGFGQAIFHSGDDTVANTLESVVAALNETVIPEARLPEYAYQAVESDGEPPGLFVTKVAHSLGTPACLHEVAEVDLDVSTQVAWTEAVVAHLLAAYDIRPVAD